MGTGAMPAWVAGLIGGFLAGGVMAAGISILAPFRGFGSPELPAKLTAATVQGVDALDGGRASVLLGACMHLALAGILGGIFALLMALFGLTNYDVFTRAGILPGAGILYSMLIFGINYLTVLPLVNRWMYQQLPLLDFAAMHILFGAIIGWAVLIWV